MQSLVASESKQTSARNMSRGHILNVPSEAITEFIFSVWHQTGFQPVTESLHYEALSSKIILVYS